MIKMKDTKGAMNHLKTHQKYPATYDELVKECNDLSDFSAEDKKEFMKMLPKRTYNSAEEVMEALGWSGKGQIG